MLSSTVAAYVNEKKMEVLVGTTAMVPNKKKKIVTVVIKE